MKWRELTQLSEADIDMAKIIKLIIIISAINLLFSALAVGHYYQIDEILFLKIGGIQWIK